MSIVTAVQLAGTPDLPLLVVLPSLGTSVTTLWSRAAQSLGNEFHVVGIDLPGHGTNRAPAPETTTMAELAAGVLEAVDAHVAPGATFHYSGDSVGGAIGLQLLLDAPDRVRSATLLCTAAKIGTAEGWAERKQQVLTQGTASLVAASAGRWFGPGYLERDGETGGAILQDLAHTDATGYAAITDALASFDVRDRLGEITAPVVAIGGTYDVATPPADLQVIAEGVQQGRQVTVTDMGHLAPVEETNLVVRTIRDLAFAATRNAMTRDEVREAGFVVRRQVLSDEHVDRSIARTTDFTRDFQSMITEYAWGTIWTRPGLDRRSRSLITLMAMIARGHHEEFAMHLKAALRNGVTVEEIKEVILQSAIYCGVPDANTAFRIAQETLGEEINDVRRP